MFGAFTTVPWANSMFGSDKVDHEAFIFALTGKRAIFKPRRPEVAVSHGTLHGPWFKGGLSLGGQWGALNGKGLSYCYTNGDYDIA